jgi:hypothetical protein
MTESELSAQTEWFHEFAKQSVDQIALQANEANRSLFARYATTSLPNHSPPEGQSPEEFARTVHELRENERQWNRALMSALIKSDDLYKAKDRKGAISVLESFAASCPWELFQEVARDQAFNYKPH